MAMNRDGVGTAQFGTKSFWGDTDEEWLLATALDLPATWHANNNKKHINENRQIGGGSPQNVETFYKLVKVRDQFSRKFNLTLFCWKCRVENCNDY